jgi:hypothetical protein
MRCSLLSLLLFCSFILAAQETKIALGTHILRIEKNMTELEAMANAKEAAKINAIENAFGVLISENNYLQTKQVKIGNEVKQQQVFNSISSAVLHAEWLKTIWEKDSIYTTSDGYRWIKYQINGEVKKLNKVPFEPEVYALNCPKTSCKTETFNSEENLYLSLKSPKKGHIAVYLNDGANTSLLLPYNKSENQSSFLVNADQSYILFDPKENKQADLIELFAETELEIHELIVLFSEKEISKPVLETATLSNKNGYLLPKKLNNTSFERWIQTYRGFDKNIQIKTIKILIKPSK